MEIVQNMKEDWTVIAFIAIGTVLLMGLVVFILWVRISDLYRMYRAKPVFIEVTPPYRVGKTPEATAQLFTILHSVGTAQRFWDRLLRRGINVSLEVVSSRSEGVRYVVRADEKEAEAVERSLLAFLSDAKIKRIAEPLYAVRESGRSGLVKEFKQKRHFALPIRTFTTYEQHDPIAYITGAMNRLEADEQVALQLVISPARVRHMATIVRRYEEYYKISEATHSKAYSQLFRVAFRVRVIGEDKIRVAARMREMEAAVHSLNIPKVQMLKARHSFPRSLKMRYREWAFTRRMPSFIHKNANIFSSLEIASLYHFPADRTQTENLVKSLSRTLPPPLSLKANPKLDVVLGQTNHYGEKVPIGLTSDERERHVYVLGGTGNGKTTMMEYAILQDIRKGNGVAVLDPHGDMAEKLLRYIPEERIKDVVYFDPDDIEYPFSLNMLELPEGITGSELERQHDLVTETLISVFRKVFSEGDHGGSRIESLLRNTIHTALTLKNPTIFTLHKLLVDFRYRNSIVPKLQNESLRDFWRNEIGEAGGMQRVKMIQGITTKLGRFLFSPYAERIFNRKKSSIDFDDIINTKKIFICNLAKGKIGEDTSELLGIMITAKLQMAALRRAHVRPEERIPFYFYIDEFQNFATPSFVEMLSEIRKYKVFLYMAEQTTAQQSRDIVKIIFANVGTKICFRTANPEDEQLLLHTFSPYILPGEIPSLSSYTFYARITAVHTHEPVSGETVLIDGDGSETIAERVIHSSRRLYGRRIKGKTLNGSVNGQSGKASDEPSEELEVIISDNTTKAAFEEIPSL